MYVNDSAVTKEVDRLIEFITHEPDPLARLTYAITALRTATERLLTARDEAAYAARHIYSAREIEAATGLYSDTVREYVKRHRENAHAPAPPRTVSRRLSTALDATDPQAGGGRVWSPSRHG